ncbi:MAG: hypothetical protein CMF75_00110 [Maricaulis sp.]|nr:hypothetical protein [Maricaulis sp.]
MIALRPGDGIDLEAIEPAPLPRIIRNGEDARAYGDLIFVRARGLHGQLQVCRAAVLSADAAADRVNAAAGDQ